MTKEDSTSSGIKAGKGELAPAPAPVDVPAGGKVRQVERTDRIRRQVNEEFDRMAEQFRLIAERQNYERRIETEAIVAILEEKRVEVMNGGPDGFLLRDGKEIADQVRQLVFHDPRYLAIKNSRTTRR